MTLDQIVGAASAAYKATSSSIPGTTAAPVARDATPGTSTAETAGMTLGGFAIVYLVLRTAGLLPRWAKII